MPGNRVFTCGRFLYVFSSRPFPDKATAEKARASLLASGVAASEIHIWNDIPTQRDVRAMRQKVARCWVVS
jgi:hypothetical protein